MPQAFCTCCRDHEWDDDPTVTVLSRLCRCGRMLDPQTTAEYAALKRAHERVLIAIAENNDLEPCMRLFRD